MKNQMWLDEKELMGIYKKGVITVIDNESNHTFLLIMFIITSFQLPSLE